MADIKDDDKVTIEAPIFDELAEPEDPLHPKRPSARAVDYTAIVEPSDSVLQQKGGITNLKVYRELLRDDQIQGAFGQRRLALTSCDTIVEPGADDPLSKRAAEFMQLEINDLPWDDITDKQEYSIFYGWGVAEVMWAPPKFDGLSVSFDSIKVRDRARFRFDRLGKLFLWESGAGFVPMPERKFWVVSTGADNHDEHYGVGLANSLYWPVFFKRNDIKYWLIFLEKFGMPTAIGKLPPGSLEDPKKRAEGIRMLRNIATDAGVLMPDTMTVELLEAARSGAGDYGALVEVMDNAIAKIIVGQTATVQGTAGKLGNDKTQADVKQSIVEADADLLCGSFNKGPVRWWTEYNFPGAVPPKVYRVTEPAEDLNARATRDKAISDLGYEPTEEYITKTYGEGFVKKPPQPVPTFGGGFGGQQGGAPEDFADAPALAALRMINRSDQDALVKAATMFASKPGVLGERIRGLLRLAEFAEDEDAFLAGLEEMLAEPPKQEDIKNMARANTGARLLGRMNTQREA